MVIYKLVYPYYIANGLRKVSMFILLLVTLLNIVMNYILIPINGIHGAAVSSVISYNLCGILFITDFAKRTNIRIKDLFIIDSGDLIYIRKFFKN